MSDLALLRPLSVARPALRLIREAPVWSGLGAALVRGRGPRVVFLPAGPRTASTLLRVHNVARGLRERGWRAHVLPWKLTLKQRQRCIAGLDPDVVVMQGSRHDLNRTELYPGRPIVYDIDDADFHLSHLAEPVARGGAGRCGGRGVVLCG